MMARVAFSTETPPIDAAVNRQNPIGGMLMPIAELISTMTPKTTGSIPICTTSGMNTGITTAMLEIVSSTVWVTIRNRLIRISSTTALVVSSKKLSATCSGICASIR
jgi:hypothetical protein